MITVKDIAKIIAARYSLSNVEAEIFMQVIAEVINDGLLQDRQVKIKGFGTFKLQTVKERNSVNVNTGEKVIIAEHDKISFVPDAVMKDLINKPFAQFETVIVEDNSPLLKDGMNLVEVITDSITSATETSENEQQETTAQDILETKDNDERKITEEDVKSGTVSYTEAANEKETVSASYDSLGQQNNETHQQNNTIHEEEENIFPQGVDKDNSPQTETCESKITTDKKHTDAHVRDLIAEGKISADNEQECTAGEQKLPADEQQECERPLPRCRNIFIYYGILINIFVAIIAFTCGYMASSYGILSEDTKEEAAKDIKKQITRGTPVNKVIIKKDIPSPAPQTEDSLKNNGKEKEDKKTRCENKIDEVDIHKYDDDIRVRTGAYYITGTDKEVIVNEGQTVASISRKYLGEGMECYVEVYNGIQKVKKGDVIKIPKLKLKKKRN